VHARAETPAWASISTSVEATTFVCFELSTTVTRVHEVIDGRARGFAQAVSATLAGSA
jgi:hypothetical protein